MKKYKHIVYLRGSGIILVVLGHSMISSIRMNNMAVSFLFNWIYLFHMPLFMAISGYLFEENINKYLEKGNFEFVLGRIKKFLIPYLTYSVCVYVVTWTMKRIRILDTVFSVFNFTGVRASLFQILTCYNNIDKHIWFLYVLFWIQIIFFHLKGFPNGIKRNSLFILCTLLLGFLHKFFEVPTILGRIINYSFFFLCGGLLRRYEIKFANKKKVCKCIYAFSLILSIIYVLIPTHFILKSSIAYFLYFLFEKGTGALISMGLILFFKKTNVNQNIRLIEVCSENSYGIYLFHQPFITSGTATVILYGFNNPYLACIAATITGIIFPIVIVKLFRKSKLLRFAFGI